MEVRVAGREGTTLGPYRLTRLLGAGGAGEVYLAEGVAPGSDAARVAVKVLRGSATDAPTQSIARQAHAVSAQHLPHALPVRTVTAAGDTLYIAMDYAPAGSLASAIGGTGAETLRLPLGAGTVARLVTQVARALQPLHQQGSVHGDLKLTNLFVRTSPQGGPLVAVGDFGQAPVLAAAVAALGQGVTDRSGGLAEALRCAAPEQLAGQHLPASDQYALATISYYLLTGQYPFEGDARAAATALTRAPVTPPTHIDPTIPLPAEAALLRALAKDPAARYPDIVSFAQALADGLASAVLSGDASQQFRHLAGASPASSGVRSTGVLPVQGARAPAVSSAGPADSGIRRVSTQMPAASGLRRAPGAHASPVRGRSTVDLLPRSPRQRLLAVAAAFALVALGLVGFLGLRVLAGGPTASHTRLPNFGGLDYAPTVTPDATVIARTRARAASGLAALERATATTPVFSDTLASNAKHWPTDGKRFTFGTDSKLHGSNNTSQSIAALNQPTSPPSDYVVSVNMTFLKASPSDVAGLSVRVLAGSDTTAPRYMMLIAPEGRFEAWYFDGAKWTNLANGYSSAIKTGLGASNALAVLCDGQEIWFFVNGQYVTNVHDFSPPGETGTLGPVVIYTTTEVTYDTYNVYQLGS
jgi:serine/threonine protein kinase